MTNQTKPHILIVDDDQSVCKTLSAILNAEGYQTTTATTAQEAMEKTKTQFFNLALLDIKLPDMEGIQLLTQLQIATSETIKIMITGYPSLKNAIEALNFGADSYIMKPIDPADLLKTIKNKLETQKQTENMTKQKLAEWILSQARKTPQSNFQEYLEETANELTHFGLTKNQAKTYITLTAIGIASASEIAALSKIRREEVYRIIPELEKHGIITRQLKVPRKFSATKPETAIKILTKTKLKTIKEEIDKLKQKQAELISRLKTIELPIKEDNCTLEIITQEDNVTEKLTEMAENAKTQIDIMAPLENLRLVYTNRPKQLMQRILNSVKIRIITENRELDSITKKIMQFSQTNNNPIELKQIEKPPFSILIVDEKEAMWGEQAASEHTPVFWTNNPTQIAILKTSFENMWQKASTIA